MTSKEKEFEVPANNYTESITTLSPGARELLVDYAGLKEEELLPHVHQMRDKAFQECPYGCVGLFAFTYPSIQRTPKYAEILDRIKNGQQYLDLGCGFGQNIRKLVFDGAPAANITGADLSQTLIDCGFEYFRDRDTLGSKFVIGDILNNESAAFVEAKGSFDIIFAAMVYHLWGWKDQVRACIETTKLLKPNTDSMIFGWQLGATPAGEVERELDNSRKHHRTMYQHDEETFKKLWEEVGTETGVNWNVQVKTTAISQLKARQGVLPTKDGSVLTAISFTVTRV